MSHLPYVWNIADITLENKAFRKVLYTGEQLQIVAMCLKPGEDTWHDMHEKQDVLIRVEKWTAVVDMDGFDYTLTDNMALVVPVWSKHNTKNTSKTDMLYIHVLYCLPQHADYKVHSTKEESEKEKPKKVVPKKPIVKSTVSNIQPTPKK